jgi:hypothetical protein
MRKPRRAKPIAASMGDEKSPDSFDKVRRRGDGPAGFSLCLACDHGRLHFLTDGASPLERRPEHLHRSRLIQAVRNDQQLTCTQESCIALPAALSTCCLGQA